jgi:hypothetical protein
MTKQVPVNANIFQKDPLPISSRSLALRTFALAVLIRSQQLLALGVKVGNVRVSGVDRGLERQSHLEFIIIVYFKLLSL